MIGLSPPAALTALAFCLLPFASRADIDSSRRSAIVTAAAAVLPATVTIGAERVAVQQINPFRTLHDDFFSDWFSDPFFGGFRRLVRIPAVGSGILVGKQGLVLTNDHVVADARKIHVTLSDGRIFPARVKGRGLPLDLALLELVPTDDGSAGAEALDLPFVTLGTAEDLALGEWAIAIGAPSNLEASVTAGVISAVGRRLPPKQDYKYFNMIQTDAAINPGNSGGPLVNAEGKVVGINTLIVSKSGVYEGLGFAIPADQARKVLTDILESGEIQLAWFGWELVDLESSGRGAEEGLRIKRVIDQSEAASAGIKSGMVLRALNGKTIRSAEEYESIIMSLRIGQVVAARVSADGSERVYRLTSRAIPPALIRVNLGLEVQDVSVRYRRAVGGGVVVTAVSPDGVFGRLSPPPVMPGDILVEINSRHIDSVESFHDVVKRLKKSSRADFTVRRKNFLFSFTIQL